MFTEMNGTAFVIVVTASAALFGVAGCRRDIPAQPKAQTPTLTKAEGVFVLRLVASLEVQANGVTKPYRVHPLADITGMSDAGPLKKAVSLLDSESGSYKGYVLRVTAQDPPYGVSLVPDKPGCARAFFYEGEVIYTGYGLGCDEKNSTPGTSAMAAPDALSPEQAVPVMRDAVTTEFAMRAQGRDFGNLSDVVGSPVWVDPGYRVRRADLPVQVLDPISATILDDTLRIATSNDKKHFRASLVPTHSPTCGSARFIDEHSVIYVGKALGC